MTRDGPAPAITDEVSSSAPESVERQRARRLGEVLFVIVFGALLFARLGHYALWDDEANTALFARNLVQSGDLEAYDGRNLVAYRDGLELTGTLNRQIPPLQYLLAAPFVALGPTSAFWARAPFALCGLGLAVLVCAWLRRARVPLRDAVLMWTLLVANVSLLLYLRQARYYAPAILLSVGFAYLYVARTERWRTVAWLALAGWALMLTHYLAYAAALAAVAVDFLVWGRRERRTPIAHVGALALSQVAFAVAYLLLWQPTFHPVSDYRPDSVLTDKLTLLWWNLRDLNACELSAAWVLLAAPAIALATRGVDRTLARASLALGVVVIVVTLLSPQPVGQSKVADVRYLAPAIPLGLFITWRVALWLDGKRAWAGVVLVALVALTNLVHLPFPRHQPQAPRATWIAYAQELASPWDNPYRIGARWLDANAEAGASVWVAPGYATYPLMYHAPRFTYAWQLDPSKREALPHLPEIHFRGLAAPDYLIGFGRFVGRAREEVDNANERGVAYEPVATLPVEGTDYTRPELFWRRFEPSIARAPERDGVVIFRRAGGGSGQALGRRPLADPASRLRAGVLRMGRELFSPRSAPGSAAPEPSERP